MLSAHQPADPSGARIVSRPDLAEAALFHLSFAIGCLVAGAALLMWPQPHGIRWHPVREVETAVPIVTRAAFDDWAGRLLVARSGFHA